VPRNLRTPGNSLDTILFFGRLGQNIESRQRIAMEFQRFLGSAAGTAEIPLL
jgi:hypothetical protein